MGRDTQGNVGAAIVETIDDVAVVRLLGEHDMSTVPAWEQTATGLIEAGTPVVIDVSETEFIDSQGLGAILRLDKDSRARGRPLVLIYGTASIVERAFEISGVLDLVEHTGTAEEAVGRVSRGSPSATDVQVTPEDVLRRMIGAIDAADDGKLSRVIHPEADLGSLIAKRRLSGRNEVIRAFAEKRRRGLLRITLLSVENLTASVGLAHASVRRPIEPSGFAESTVYYLFEIEESQVRWADYFPNPEAALETFTSRQGAPLLAEH